MNHNQRNEPQSHDPGAVWQPIKDWWGRHGTKLLLLILLLVAGIWGYTEWSNRRARAEAVRTNEFDKRKTGLDLYNLAEETSDPQFKARCYLTGADLVRKQALQAVGDQKQMITEKQRAEYLKTAKRGYDSVLAIADANILYRLNAKLGLAAICEFDGEWGKADDMYAEIALEAEKSNLPGIVAQAKARPALNQRARLPRLLSEDPVPPTTAPASQPATTQATQPAETTTQPAHP